MHAQSRREPTVSLIEDLHWIDRGSEAFLENLVDALPGTRTHLIVNFRPEYHAAVKRACFVRAHQCPIRNPYLNTALEAAIAFTTDSRGRPDSRRP
jgi:hypothetical protein